MSEKKASSGGDAQADKQNSEPDTAQELDLDLSREIADDTRVDDDGTEVEDTQVLNRGELLDDSDGASAADAVNGASADAGIDGAGLPDETISADEQSQSLAAELAEELAAARLEADGFRDHYLRAQAELENERRKHQRELEKAHKFALEKIASELLSVRDNLERGLEASRAEGASVELIIEGTELTLKSLTQVMEKFKIVAVDPAGEKFNPDYHQAISMQPAEGVASGIVTAVIQKGYTLNERLIRPAMVVVAK